MFATTTGGSLFEILSRGDWIRTSDLMLPKHAHYQAVLHPVTFVLLRSGGLG